MKDSVIARISILGVGFIGWNLLNSYVGSDHDTRVLDRKPCPDDFRKNVHWTPGYLEELNKVRHAIKGVELEFEAKMPFKNGLKRTLSLYEKRYPKLHETLVLNDT